MLHEGRRGLRLLAGGHPLHLHVAHGGGGAHAALHDVDPLLLLHRGAPAKGVPALRRTTIQKKLIFSKKLIILIILIIIIIMLLWKKILGILETEKKEKFIVINFKTK